MQHLINSSSDDFRDVFIQQLVAMMIWTSCACVPQFLFCESAAILGYQMLE